MDKENEKFIIWYNSLKTYEKTYLKMQICNRCEVTQATFYKWIRGAYVRNPYREIINSVSKRHLFTLEYEIV